jgi:hypothetical protein
MKELLVFSGTILEVSITFKFFSGEIPLEENQPQVYCI